MLEETKINGIQSAVRYKDMTPEEALEELEEDRRNRYFIKPSIIRWLKKRIKK